MTTYVNLEYAGPRNGRRHADYFTEIQSAVLELGVNTDGAVLRLRTRGGHINLSMDLAELETLRAAIADPEPAAEEWAASLPPDTPTAPAPDLQALAQPDASDPPSLLDRLLSDDDILEASP